MSRAGFQTAAWSWADHLRDGGTTPWLDWLRTLPSDLPDALGRGPVPGAAQLELVRRLALRRARQEGDPAFAELADRALRRSGPGRGPAHLSLLWPDDDRPRRVGAPPIDPSGIPADELARVGIGLLAEVLALHPVPAPVEPELPRRRLWSQAFHLAGAPVTTAAVRSSLAAAGHVEGGRRPEVLLFAEPLDVLLAQIWSIRVQRGAPVRWVTFAGRWARRDQLPPSADLAVIAAFWADRVGAGRVHVVAGPDPRRTAAQILGLRTADPVTAPDPHSLPPAAVDVVRRLNRVLNVRLGDEARIATLRHVASLLPEDPAPALDVPTRHRAWLDDRARRVADDLRSGGYAVHGDLARIAPRHVGAAHPRNRDVLELVLDTCLRAAELDT
ncbi:MAG: hypothetical protein ACXWXO_00270 [Nocardioides sp.]